MNQHPGGSPGQHGNSFRSCLSQQQQQQQQAAADCTARVSIAASSNPDLHAPAAANAATVAAGERIKHEADTAAYADMAQLLKQKYLAAQSAMSSSPAYSNVSPEAHLRAGLFDPQQGGIGGDGGAVAALSGLISSRTMDHSGSMEGGIEGGVAELARSFGRPPSTPVPRAAVKQCAPAPPSPACHSVAASYQTNHATFFNGRYRSVSACQLFASSPPLNATALLQRQAAV